MPASPILDLQNDAGAKLGENHGWQLPSVYSSVADEYEAARRGVGLVDRSHVGRLRLTGEDGLDLLNRLSTNELEDLAVGQGRSTVLTSNKGRILDLLLVLNRSDHLLVITSPESRQKVADWIDFYTFTEDVAVQDVTEDTAMLAVMGPGAAGLLESLGVSDIGTQERYQSVSAAIGDTETVVVRTDFAGPPAFELIVPAPDGTRLWQELLKKGAPEGLRPVGLEALEIVRVESGVPLYGREMSEEVNPLEANLKGSISFNKGCYIGQEVVARLDTYEKVQRYLVGLRWDSDTVPPPGTDLLADGKKVGKITSAVALPEKGRGIGMGYVAKAHARPGVRLTIATPRDGISALVRDLDISP
jgi:glycine cleavage system T protein